MFILYRSRFCLGCWFDEGGRVETTIKKFRSGRKRDRLCKRFVSDAGASDLEDFVEAHVSRDRGSRTRMGGKLK
jgi:hypothetical protein